MSTEDVDKETDLRQRLADALRENRRLSTGWQEEARARERAESVIDAALERADCADRSLAAERDKLALVSRLLQPIRINTDESELHRRVHAALELFKTWEGEL